MATELEFTEIYIDKALEEDDAGRFTVVDAAMAKWWTTELQKRVIDRCVQLHGEYGYMLEYPVAKAYLDARVQTIHGGTTESRGRLTSVRRVRLAGPEVALGSTFPHPDAG